jgi:prepilin-type N-terminal cleavage/methylation domain-containing protein
MQKRRGFTYLELAATLAIVAIILVTLHAVFARQRDKAMAASCLSNAKCMGLGYAMYATDNDNKLPLYDNGSKPRYITSPMGEPRRSTAAPGLTTPTPMTAITGLW